jgi:hypothetical protein
MRCEEVHTLLEQWSPSARRKQGVHKLTGYEGTDLKTSSITLTSFIPYTHVAVFYSLPYATSSQHGRVPCWSRDRLACKAL